nr:hypothetical protein [uncultured Blautia sp.]
MSSGRSRDCLLLIYEVTAKHPEFFLQDGIHPNKLGAGTIARTAYEKLKDLGY